MDDRTRIHSARRAQEMRALQVRAGRFELAMAAAKERQKVDVLETQQQDLETAFADWSAVLDGGLDADAVRRSSGNVVHCQRAMIDAQTQADEAATQRQAAAEASGVSQLRLAQASTLFRALRRQEERKRSEKTARSTEDRSAIARWRRS